MSGYGCPRFAPFLTYHVTDVTRNTEMQQELWLGNSNTKSGVARCVTRPWTSRYEDVEGIQLA
jgi:hypothetical protein